jgi:hypothetical protein
MPEPADILVPIPADQVATHRKPRVYGAQVINAKSERSISFLWQSVPGRLVNGEFVETDGPAREEPSLSVNVPFDPQDADHVAVLVALDRIAKKSAGFTP